MKKSKMINQKLILSMLAAVILLATAATAAVTDPMSVGVGARAIGMGRTYVGVAEDGDTIFVNPAGLARINSPRISSMYSSLMGDVNYTVIGGVYPYGENSAIGVGMINSGCADIPLSNSDGSSAGNGNWSNTVMFLSGGTHLNKNLMVGGSFKYFSVGGAGKNDIADVANSAGNGYSADVGLLYPATEYLTLGANFQNILSSKITRSSGVNEDLPRTLKIGGKLALLGKEGQAYTVHKNRRLYLNADYDINSNSANTPHLGVEFWPMGNMAVRAGMDGENPTAGLGVRFSGIEVNYAYHPYSNIGDNATHFVSIGYLGEGVKRSLQVLLDNPKDKSVIYEDHVTVSGKIKVVEGDEDAGSPGALSLKINGINVPVAADKTFSAEMPVDTIGKKLLAVEVSDAAGDSFSQDFRLVRLIQFADVPEGYWARNPIENTGTVGLVQGYPDGTFRPDSTLTRAELATLLVRAKGLQLPDRQARVIFKDVKPDFWGAKYIEVAYDAGLIKGYPDKTFRANNKINKAEGIAVTARFDNLRLTEVYEKPYWDVSANHWAAKYIQAAKEAGLLKYVEQNRLRPKEGLARAEAVEMLAKTSMADAKIKDLYTWEKGFRRELEVQPKIRASIF